MDKHFYNKKCMNLLIHGVENYKENIDKPVFIMMCGLPCSGKTRFANKILDKDTIYVNGYDNTNIRNIIKRYLKIGYNVIYDNDNLLSRKRRTFLKELDDIDCYKKCVIIATPFEQCIKNGTGYISEDVIDNAYRKWNTPYYFEGFDEIEVVYNQTHEHSYDSKWFGFPNDRVDYDQHNPHHNMTLGNHCIAAGNCLSANNEDICLVLAGYLHDIGKVHTQCFDGESAHYRRHENVGAYEVLFFNTVDWWESLHISLLVNLHMYPHWWSSNSNKDKLHEKYKNIWGEVVYNDVMKLHEADRKAK